MRTLVILCFAFFIALISFQNCSLYKSEGISKLEEEGVDIHNNDTSPSSKITAKEKATCENLDKTSLSNVVTNAHLSIDYKNQVCVIEGANKIYECGIRSDLEGLFLSPESYHEDFLFIEGTNADLPKKDFQQLRFFDYQSSHAVYAAWPVGSKEIWFCQALSDKETIEDDLATLSQILELILIP